MSQQIRCSCGKFRAELTEFPKATPGRLQCYCDDCQLYMVQLGRTDLLGPSGVSEVIPTYPASFKIVAGQEHLKCTRLSANGMFRFSTTCCNSPVANTSPGTPWVGVMRSMYTQDDAQLPEKAVGNVRASIMGKFATGPVPAGVPAKMNFKGFVTVMPFMLKGFLGKKIMPSPFFKEDGKTPVVAPTILSAEQREQLVQKWQKGR